MGKWWMGALVAIGWLGASAATDAQTGPVPAAAAPSCAPPAYVPIPPAGMSAIAQPPPVTFAPDTPPPPPPAYVPASPPTAPEGPSMDPGVCEQACDTPDAGCPSPKCHTAFEYLAWWTKHGGLPLLATSGSLADPIPGAVGQPNTDALIFGSIDKTAHNGGRLRFRYDVGADGDWTLDASAFVLQQESATRGVSGSGAVGTAVIARPFFNANTGQQDADPIAVPGVQSGSFAVQTTQRIYGAEANAAWNYWCHDGDSVSGYLLLGGRTLWLEEKLADSENLQDLPGLGQAGNTSSLSESFTTRNLYYGVQAGAEYAWRFGPITLEVLGKVGVGVNHENVKISGFTQVVEPDGTVVSAPNRSLLVQPSNAGSFDHDRLAVFPELAVNGTYDITDHIRLGAGYDFLYLSNVLRPGDQVDPVVNVQALQPFDQVGPARPGVPFRQSNFWIQGVNLSLELSF